jgi:hypothetical protein
MQKKIFGGFVVFLIGTLILASCAKHTVTIPTNNVDTTKQVSYKDNIQPIFTAGCLGSLCHSGSVAPNLTTGNSYNALMTGGFVNTATPDQSEIYLEMKPGGGMSTHCTADDANLVLLWITKGAKDN